MCVLLYTKLFLQDQIRTKTAESVDLTDSLGNVNDNLAAIRLTLSELQSQFDQVLILLISISFYSIKEDMNIKI